ncbi:MAG: hypothetical protein ACI8R4_003877, partial [Paracoccaceae bacterium]
PISVADLSRLGAAYDPDALRARAAENTRVLFPGNATVPQDIADEALLVSGQGRGLFVAVLDQAQATPDSSALTGPERRHMGQLALRLVGSLGLENHLMQSDSVGGQARASSRKGAAYTAQDLQAMVGAAMADGFSDAELFSVWIDLWAVAILSDVPEVAAKAADHTALCRAAPCAGDLVLGYFDQAKAVPKIARPQGMKELFLRAADPFVRAEFPGEPLKLADLYETGVGGAQHRPMDAARYDQLSMRYVESAKNIAPSDLVTRAARVMETLVYASKYSAAAALGDRIATRARSSYASAVDLAIAGH